MISPTPAPPWAIHIVCEELTGETTCAQNFKTAKELGLADVEVNALVTVLRMLLMLQPM